MCWGRILPIRVRRADQGSVDEVRDRSVLDTPNFEAAIGGRLSALALDGFLPVAET